MTADRQYCNYTLNACFLSLDRNPRRVFDELCDEFAVTGTTWLTFVIDTAWHLVFLAKRYGDVYFGIKRSNFSGVPQGTKTLPLKRALDSPRYSIFLSTFVFEGLSEGSPTFLLSSGWVQRATGLIHASEIKNKWPLIGRCYLVINCLLAHPSEHHMSAQKFYFF